jgi:SAM-dependent methyltransferase
VRRVSVPSDLVVSVGGGDSTLIDELLVAGYRRIVVVDVAPTALARLMERLVARFGEAAEAVEVRVADVRQLTLEAPVDVWHDRAVFHFMVEAADRDAYVDRAAAAVRPGGHLVIATFALDAPDRCSGLPVARYDADGLAAAFAPSFELVEALTDEHRTPWGVAQPFQHAILRRVSGGSR